MKIKYTLPKLAAIFLFIIGLASCQEDFEPLVSNIGVQNFDSDLYISNNVVAYSRKLPPVQTNALPSYQLGIYNDPVYGKSTVNLLSQILMQSTNPDFGDSTELQSVILYIPYYATGTTTDDVLTYKLDSVYGASPITISMYESNYFLREFDPGTNFEEAQQYYSSQGQLFNNFTGPLIHTIEDFIPSAAEIIVTEDDPETEEDEEEKLPPGLRVELPIEYFQEKILNKEGGSELINNNNFKEYFRGVYFKATSNTNDGSLFIFDLSKVEFSLNYTHVVTTTSDGNTTSETEEESFLLGLGGISVNVYDNELTPSIATALQNPDTENGEANLYLRGGDGIVTIVNLFQDADVLKVVNGELVAGSNGIPDELDEIRIKNWLINEANLIFYVDQSKVTGGSAEPERIVIFDAINGRLLKDYTFDISTSTLPVEAKTEHLGRLDRGSDDNGDFYKIRITSFVSDLIRKDSTNVSLGLMVSNNVLVQDFQDLENTQPPGIKSIPAASIVSPKGTVLFGNNTSNQEKKLKLQIYYTKPN
ncbi:uncharacterized protein DUF4270 [Ulvibacter sp. MAR_2010_11]|uniref:DUF4270 domain-containing protein n=1 Tax=Ulvibacter sp. MAR_2010_11 TaxID=1250229 RepID=UPI000C2BAD5E|nr:DUF4270 domain-containing protein [Ulvibacter sp. MAR_2010_11]PKA82723.1 uncharacterized protein DUF4270 [Ulvibacter sp. MAR_2010_11]